MNPNRDRGAVGAVFAVIGATILGLALIVGIFFGGRALHWWLVKDNTNKTAQIYQDSYGRQNALVVAILEDIRQAQDPNLPAAQRKGIVNVICDNAAQLTGTVKLSPSAQSFIAQEC